jgi:mevalonate pyrophosphate decarboxylase
MRLGRIHQQLWGYKVEEKLHLGVSEQKTPTTAGLPHSSAKSSGVDRALRSGDRAGQLKEPPGSTNFRLKSGSGAP